MSNGQDQPLWKHFEYHCWYMLLGWFPVEAGWEIEYQEEAPSGRPDFVVRHYDSNGDIDELIIVDAKDRERLSNTDIDQLVHYARDFDADRAVYMVAWDTNFSESVSDQIEGIGIDIVRTEWRHPGSLCYCFDPEVEFNHCFEWPDD